MSILVMKINCSVGKVIFIFHHHHHHHFFARACTFLHERARIQTYWYFTCYWCVFQARSQSNSCIFVFKGFFHVVFCFKISVIFLNDVAWFFWTTCGLAGNKSYTGKVVGWLCSWPGINLLHIHSCIFCLYFFLTLLTYFALFWSHALCEQQNFFKPSQLNDKLYFHDDNRSKFTWMF